MRLSRVLALGCFAVGLLTNVATTARGENAEYTAVFNDGKRIKGHLGEWGGGNNPKLNGAPLFDVNNPIRWLKKETGETAATPAAFVEMFGGDLLPGRLISVGSHSVLEEGRQLPYLIVEPSVNINWFDGPQRTRIRVASRWVRRIVWERRTADDYQPATIYYRDGRQIGFRSLRFSAQGISALTDTDRRDIRYNELAEIDMPKLDWWDSYCEQLALVNPDCKSRLCRMETSDGMMLTTSGDRLQPMPWGDVNNPDCWRHAVQPAWALDSIWIEHNRVLMRRYFSPHEVPVSLVEPSDTKLRAALAVGWRPQLDRNAEDGPLMSGGKEWGWGLGMHAYAEMRFPLPACVRSLRSQVGLDQVVGGGGCARAIVYLDKSEGQPLWRSDHLIGSNKTVDTGDIALDSHGGKSQVVLVAHPAHADRPEGADPLDIRDVVDWLEPQFNLDLAALRSEVRAKLWRLLPSLEGWDVSAADRDAMDWATRWENAGNPFRYFPLEFRPTGASVTFTRKLHIDDDQNFLLLYASRNTDGGKANPTQMLVKINGKQEAEAEPQARWGPPGPSVVAVDKYHNQDVTLEVRFVSRGDKSFVEWGSFALVDRLPTLAEVFEDAVRPPGKIKWTDVPKASVDVAGANAPAVATAKSSDGEKGVITADRYSGTACLLAPRGDKQLTISGVSLPIRENPHFGEYRYLRYAWRVRGGQQINLDLSFAPGADQSLSREQQAKRLKTITGLMDQLQRDSARLEAIKKKPETAKLGNKTPKVIASLEASVQSLRKSIEDLERPPAQAEAANVLYRFFAGNPWPAPGDMRNYRVADKAPGSWQVVVRDLYTDFGGPGELTALSLGTPDGEAALLDHVYLARTPQDFDRCPQQAPPLVGK